MEPDRGTLANIDRKVLALLSRLGSYRMVRLPIAEAMWSTWRRYCSALGVSMGRGIGELIANELGTVVRRDTDDGAQLSENLQQQLIERSEDLDARERSLVERDRAITASERRQWAGIQRITLSPGVKIGRNESCPCGSGVKYKRCHGT